MSPSTHTYTRHASHRRFANVDVDVTHHYSRLLCPNFREERDHFLREGRLGMEWGLEFLCAGGEGGKEERIGTWSRVFTIVRKVVRVATLTESIRV
jgi:hypothetical protein